MITEDNEVGHTILKNIMAADHHGWCAPVADNVTVFLMPANSGGTIIEICTASKGSLWQAFVAWVMSDENTYGIHSVPFI